MSTKCSFEKTDPHGFDGLLIKNATVFLSINFSTISKSISHDLSGYFFFMIHKFNSKNGEKNYIQVIVSDFNSFRVAKCSIQ